MATPDVAKFGAFRSVKEDNVDSLAEVLDRHTPEAWSQWRNFAGKTLYQLAEKSTAAGHHSRCLELLRGRLQGLGLVPQQVPKVEYVERVHVVPQVVEKRFEVPVPDIHHHKTLKHVPKFTITEVPEVHEVGQITYKEELRVIEETVDVPRQIPFTTIKEVPKFQRVKGATTTETTEIPWELSLPPVERIGIVPKVDFDVKVHLVPGEQKHLPEEQETIHVPHELFVPKTEVKFVEKEVKRDRPITVKHVKERAEIVRTYHEEYIPVEVTETNIVQNIKYVPKLPMKTEWVPRGSRVATGFAGLSAEFVSLDANQDGIVSADEFCAAGGTAQEFRRIDADHSGGISRAEYVFDRLDRNHDGVITRSEFYGGLAGTSRQRTAADFDGDMWVELNMLRCEHSHLVKASSRSQDDLARCRDRVRRLREQLESERRLREGEEHQLRQRATAATSLYLKPLPVKTDSSLEVGRWLNESQSTIYRSSPDASFLIGSPLTTSWQRESRADVLFDRIDMNRDGVITREEFNSWSRR